MQFLKPRKGRKVDWKISERTLAIVKGYAQYTELTEEQVVDQFLTNILEDKDFKNWLLNKRYNKRLSEQIFQSNETGNADGEVKHISESK